MPDSTISVALQTELLDRLPLGVLVYHLGDPGDPGSLRLVQANKATSRAIGFDVRQDLGRTIREASPQVLETELPAAYAEIAQGGPGRDLGEIEYGDDRIEPGIFRVSAFPLPDRHVGIVFEEVSQQRSEEEARLLAVVDNLPALAWSARPDGHIDFYNSRWYEYTGTTPEEMEGWGWKAVHDPDILPSVIERWQHSIDTGEPFEMEFPLRAVDGTFRWFLTRVRPLRDAEGEITRWVGTNSDIHDARAAEAALRESEARFRDLFAAIDEGFCLAEMVLDADGQPVSYRFLEVNPLFEEMSGLTDAGGRTIHELAPDIEPHWVETYARAALGGEAIRFESRSEALGRWFDVFAAPVEPRGRFAVVFKDVTEQKEAEQALAESEAHYRFMSETLQQQIWTARPDGQLDFVNHYVLGYFGRSYDEMIGLGWQGVVHEDDLPRVAERWSRALETGDPYEVEFRLRNAEDGSWRWHLGRASALRDDRGEIVKWFGANTDIHAKKKIETVMVEANRALEGHVAERTQELEGFSEDLKLLHRITTTRHASPEEVFQEYLRAGCEIFEMPIGILSETPLDEATGTRTYRLHTVESPVPEVVAGLEMPISEAFCDAVVERGRTVSYADVCSEGDEVACKAAHAEHGLNSFIGTPLVVDGELFGTLNFVSPEPRPQGFAPHEHELIEVMAESVVQMLSLQRAERRSAEAEARSRSIVHTVEEGLMLVEADGTVLMSNPAARRMLGLEAEGVLGGVTGPPRWQVIYPDGTPVPDHDLPERSVFLSGQPMRGVVQGIVGENGLTRWFSVNARPAGRGEDEAVTSVVVSFNDITEQLHVEQSLKRNAEQLAERNAELEQFAYVASHDLQEPLRMVSSFLQLLQRRYADQLDETADEYIAYAVDGAKRMQVLIQDLLAYSRVGTRGKAFKPVDVGRTLETVLTDLGPALEDTGATVEAGALPTLPADETQLRQLLQNLVANAIKFHGDKTPVVRVSAEEAEEDGRALWRIAVADNGIGIEPHHAERVFQIFQRLHTRDEYEGTGIGLAMCKKIVERHGGRIWFESEPGDGTTFYFTIPLSQPTPPDRADG